MSVIINSKEVKKPKKMIKGHTISNLKLLNLTHYGKPNDWVIGCTMPNNSRDVFLNVNYDFMGIPEDIQYISTIIHEVTHNILVKYFGNRTSQKFDNLWYDEELIKKLDAKLFDGKKDEWMNFWDHPKINSKT